MHREPAQPQWAGPSDATKKKVARYAVAILVLLLAIVAWQAFNNSPKERERASTEIDLNNPKNCLHEGNCPNNVVAPVRYDGNGLHFVPISNSYLSGIIFSSTCNWRLGEKPFDKNGYVIQPEGHAAVFVEPNSKRENFHMSGSDGVDTTIYVAGLSKTISLELYNCR